MSLLFMLLALVGCLLVLGGGSYALRRVIAYLGSRPDAVGEDSGPPSAVSAADREHVGGYVFAPRPDGEGREPEDVASSVRARAANLVALGRIEEAVRVVRERAGADEERARRIVGALERSADPGPALEP
ncbi:hypothetical protein [Nocardiopsis sp. NRRL B-16309]|uniref:hypothetical protein n=1 Tax=Nocardiopsis sp. NRRL B-16309 TaxID=1519494 RepID=UPI0006AE4611|nr:hypothetical protein [Nocardiopsis sp. NRRL B-16309]KOX16427.1 hypothetical protein ADL05_11790 [Nocardiopsis sp. NRRL B-16309]